MTWHRALITIVNNNNTNNNAFKLYHTVLASLCLKTPAMLFTLMINWAQTHSVEVM